MRKHPIHLKSLFTKLWHLMYTARLLHYNTVYFLWYILYAVHNNLQHTATFRIKQCHIKWVPFCGVHSAPYKERHYSFYGVTLHRVLRCQFIRIYSFYGVHRMNVVNERHLLPFLLLVSLISTFFSSVFWLHIILHLNSLHLGAK